MLYPVYVHLGDTEHAHGVTFPDFPGCFAAADEWDGLPAAVQEAVQAHFYGEPDAVPAPTPMTLLAHDPRYQGGAWLLVDIDLSRIEGRAVRLNVSLPANLVNQVATFVFDNQHTPVHQWLASARPAKAVSLRPVRTSLARHPRRPRSR